MMVSIKAYFANAYHVSNIHHAATCCFGLSTSCKTSVTLLTDDPVQHNGEYQEVCVAKDGTNLVPTHLSICIENEQERMF